MTVWTRAIASFSSRGADGIGAVRLPDRIVASFVTGTRVPAVRAAFGASLMRLDGPKNALQAHLHPDTEVPAQEAEIDLLAGKSVLFAIRNGETAEAAMNWVSYHAKTQGAEAALIFDRSPPGKTGFAEALGGLRPAIDVLIVTGDRPTGLEDGPDLRDPATAPAAPKPDPAEQNPWFATFRQLGLLDHLRHRFLSEARAVACLDIADLALPSETTIFDFATAHPGQFIPLTGIETYPWRLRQGTAHHADHIARRRRERRRLLSWVVTPESMPEDAVWRPGQPFRMDATETTASFIRAMGVVYPGAPVGSLVRKADLREEPDLIDTLKTAFGTDPIRLPSPATIPPRPENGKTTLVTAMKNEGPFVLDWIAHNRVAGITNILAYTNDCEDGTNRLLSLLKDANVLHRDNPYRQTGKVPQHAAFRAAEEEPVVEEADWLLTLDVDEYLNIHAGEGRIDDLLAATPEAHAISIPWRLFGNADQHSFADRPVTEQFTCAAPEYATRPLQAWAYKTIYRNAGLFRRLGVHRPKGLNTGYRAHLNWADATGTALPPVIHDRVWRASKGQWGYTHAAINHYAVRSAESFLVKRARGKVNRIGQELGLAYWFRMNHNADEDRSILRMSERVAREKASLLALPGVAEAHDQAVAWHRTRIAGLKSEPDFAKLYEQITSPRMERLSRMATNFGALVHRTGPEIIPDEIVARDPFKPFFWTVP